MEEICRKMKEGSLGVLPELGIMYVQARKVVDVVDSALECQSFSSIPKVSEELKNEFTQLQQDAGTSGEWAGLLGAADIILKRSAILNSLSNLGLEFWHNIVYSG
jgi:hypothetical protein